MDITYKGKTITLDKKYGVFQETHTKTMFDIYTHHNLAKKIKLIPETEEGVTEIGDKIDKQKTLLNSFIDNPELFNTPDPDQDTTIASSENLIGLYSDLLEIAEGE
ncbi:MAG: hypothetical protein KAS32_03845 [Candidatus Peribacteraceae bacterium]|nr:hypothetical protein [Candidatus Peribacteraceae bacterium]